MSRPRRSRSCRSPGRGAANHDDGGQFVRAAYNNEGYVILGYQASDRSVGDPWMLLEIGMTIRDKTPDYRLTRAAISLETPDGKTIPLPTAPEQREGNPRRFSTGECPARFHQLLSAGGEPAVRPPFLSRTGVSLAAIRRDGAHQRPRLCRSSLFSYRRRYQVRPALAQREVPEQPRARALPDSDQGRRAAPLEELQEHREAGRGRVQTEEVSTLGLRRLTVGGLCLALAAPLRSRDIMSSDEKIQRSSLPSVYLAKRQLEVKSQSLNYQKIAQGGRHLREPARTSGSIVNASSLSRGLDDHTLSSQ